MIKKAVILAGATAALLTAGLGVGSASAATLTPDQVTAAQAAARPQRDFCDDWNHRGHPQCRRADRWYWNAREHRWHHQRYDTRWHRWYER